MKKFLPVLFILFVYSCEAQPNRPITAIDRIDNLNSPKPSASVTASPNPSSSPSNSLVIPTPAPSNNPNSDNTQKVVFKGRVGDIADNKPLEGVKITISTYSVVTDADGLFVIPDFPLGLYDFVASKEGYIDFIHEQFELKKDFGRLEIYMRKKP